MIMIHQRHRQTDRQTTCNRNTALCTIVHRAVKIDFDTTRMQSLQTPIHMFTVHATLGENRLRNNDQNEGLFTAIKSRLRRLVNPA